ncbi:S-layer homology domain-containing protein [Paenibacillus pini]|uniref:SLH domain-containing protein n=1 Tax=Paenibacillus pini JCM 16418 TaxID=1236976 RepID=W7YFS3_9BACL|nr:S-layer homology domain-containing protein [Paenibacillus pini]GAF07327.1 hypothetical protein JCM16418_1337 [Paenibacillus pini JCM 16418]
MTKEKMKHIVRTVLLLVAVFGYTTGFVPGLTHAEPTTAVKLQLVIGEITAKTGDAVQLPVTLQNPSHNIASYNLQLDYNPASIEVLAITPTYGDSTPACESSQNGCFQSNINNTQGWVRAIWVDSTGGNRMLSSTQQLFTIQVKIKGIAMDGKAFTVDSDNPEHLNLTGVDEKVSYPAEIKGGRITLSQSGSTSSGDGSANIPVQVPAQPVPTNVRVVLDGKEQQNMATANISKVNGREIITISVDNDKVIHQIANGTMNTLLLPVSTTSEEVVGVLNGQLLKEMQNKAAKVEIQTDRATYTLPAVQIGIDDLSRKLGQDVSLKDILINVKISEASDESTKAAQTKAAAGHMSLIVRPVNFEVEAKYKDKKVSVTQFTDYVERSITLPDEVDPDKITTGVVVGKDGELSHVPTQIVKKDGRYYAVINSLTNSTYAVVWNPKTFTDTIKHWSRSDVENLASRLVIQGVGPDQFDPDRNITRAEFVSIVLRSLGIHQSSTSIVSFKDVKASDWFADEVNTGVSYQLIKGYDNGTFKPNGLLTRAEAMTILDRAFAIVKIDKVTQDIEANQLLADYKDSAALEPWAKYAAASAIKLGIVKGTNGQLNPRGEITRAQTAAIMNRFLIKSELINE